MYLYTLWNGVEKSHEPIVAVTIQVRVAVGLWTFRASTCCSAVSALWACTCQVGINPSPSPSSSFIPNSGPGPVECTHAVHAVLGTWLSSGLRLHQLH